MKLHSMKTRFAATIAVAYVIIAIFTYLVFYLVTAGIVQNLSTDFAVKQAELNKSKLMSAVQHDLSLSLKMSVSPLLIQWALDEENPELKRRALKELENYRARFKGQSLTFIPDRSGNNYFLDGKRGTDPGKPRYTLSEGNLQDAWYFRVMREVEKSELNVDYDEKLNVTRVWFNVVIKDADNNKIGVCGSSIDITEFINEIVGAGRQEAATILFSRDGGITGHHDRSYVNNNSRVRGNQKKITVYDLIEGEADRAALTNAVTLLSSGVLETETTYLSIGGKRYLAAVSYLKEIDWFNLVLVDTTHVVSKRDFFPIIATIILSLLVVIVIMGFLLNKVVLTPLSRLTESVGLIAKGHFDTVLPISSDDEIGALNRSFNDMAKMVKDYTENLENMVSDRTKRLESVNYELQTINEEVTVRSYELEAALDALQRSQDRLRLILDSTAEAIYGTDLNGDCTFCNTACVCLLGYSHPDDLVGKNMHALIHHKHKNGAPFPEKECPIYISLWKEEGIHVDDEVFWRADGTSFPVEYWAFPQFRNGKVVGAVATFMDIADRIQVQEKLLKLSRAVENSPATVVITNRNGIIEYVNPKFTEITGYLPEEALGQNPRILNAGVQSKEFYQELWSTITAGNEWRGEFCNSKKNGEIHWEYASISPIRDEKGTITHFVAVKEDITERRRIAEELHQAKETAEATNRLKSEFLANMSHEIRTPLNAIIGFSQLALSTELSQQSHDYVNKISKAGESLLKTINDILDFSKIEADKLDMEHALFRLDEMLSDVLSIVQQKAMEKRLQLLLDVAPELPEKLWGDSHRLGQVIINLLGNAVKFTEEGEVRLSVSLHEQTATHAKLHFAVSDSGVGLSPETLSALFQPFIQADGSTTRRFGGTGLGLSISKRLVEMMGGDIWCESEPGAGSIFSFTAWFEIGQAEKTASSDTTGQQADGTSRSSAIRESYSGEAGMRYDFSGSRVLLVEDNEVNRQLALELLKRVGIRADIAVNGREAVVKITSEGTRYDLVLMDIQMPEMDGYEATRFIRKNSRFSNLPMIAMTAHAMLEERQKIAAAGLNDHITKPIDSREMFRIMSRHLKPAPAVLSSGIQEEHDREQVVALPEIQGLDTEAALGRLEENRELYLLTLQMFVNNQSGTASAFQKALADNDRRLAERLAHTCRGVAGNIGATRLQQLAMTLERAVHHNEPDTTIENEFKPFADELERIVQSLRSTLPDPSGTLSDTSENKALDRDRARKAMVLLQRYLLDYDGRAGHCLQECRDDLSGLPQDILNRLRLSVENFDFSVAIDVLAELSAKAGISILPPTKDD